MGLWLVIWISPKKILCSLGCALEFKFDKTPQEVYSAQVALQVSSYIGDHQVGLHYTHMAIALMDKMDNEYDMNQNTSYIMHLNKWNN